MYNKYCAYFIEQTHVEKYNENTAEDKQLLPDFNTFKNITSAFIHLTSNVTKHLKKAEFIMLRRACILQTKTPRGAKLTPELVEKISTAKNLDDLLDTLAISPYWSWIDLRLLEAMTVASESVIGEALLKSYKQVVFSKKLNELMPNSPSKKIKEELYTKIVSKLNKNQDDVTVADLLEFQSQLEAVIMDIGNGTCVLDHFEDGCLKVYWYLPTHCVDHAYYSAILKCHKFHELSLTYLQIGSFPAIYDPLSTHVTLPAMSEPQLPANVGKVERIFCAK